MRKFIFVILTLSLCGSPLFAQEGQEGLTCPEQVYLPFLLARGGDGRSYDNGYQAAGVMAIQPLPTLSNYLFLDLQFNQVDGGRYARNYGIGWRGFLDSCSSMVGANIFYDSRRLLGHTYHQFGFGGELFTPYVDFRINGYLPFGDKAAAESVERLNFSSSFYVKRFRFQTAMWGLDIEFGRSFNFCERLCLYLGVGPYFYDTTGNCDCSDALLGGMGRATLTLCGCLEFDFYMTYDKLFRGNPQGQIYWNIPLGCLSCCIKNCIPRVFRNPIIITTDTCKFQKNW